MRTIKFRAWQKNYGGYMFYSHESKGLGYLEFNNDSSTVIGESDGDQRYEASEMPLMQFTGLFDKNGKEIYEGDVVKYERYDKIIFATIKWREGEGCYHLLNHKDSVDSDALFSESAFYIDMRRLEIIGNIYQNPELIN